MIYSVCQSSKLSYTCSSWCVTRLYTLFYQLKSFSWLVYGSSRKRYCRRAVSVMFLLPTRHMQYFFPLPREWRVLVYNRIPGTSRVLLCGRGNGLRSGPQKRLEDIRSSRDGINSTVTRVRFARLDWRTERDSLGFGCVFAELGKTNDYFCLEKTNVQLRINGIFHERA